MQTNIDYLFTGYTDLRHLNLANSQTSDEAHCSANVLMNLMDQFLDTTQCTYLDEAEKLDGPSGLQDLKLQTQRTSLEKSEKLDGPSGLQESKLLAQLPWLTPWPVLFEASDSIRVIRIKKICNIYTD